MGIDKSNIRYVVHGDLPKNIEGYYQETGRSGRDGEPAECVLFFNYGDVQKLRYFVKQVEDPQQREIQQQKLNQMANFGSSFQCRRRQILRYFGEKYPSDNCGACDICAPDARRIDATREAQIVMSAVTRTQEQSDARHVIDIVTGQASDKVRALGHDQLKTFGVGKDRDAQDWAQTVADLIERGCLLKAGDDAPLTLTDKGKDVLFGRRQFTFIRTPAQVPQIADDKAEVLRVEVEDEDLFDVLRSLRKRLAKDRGVPPYVVFSDRTLRELARVKPTTLAQMREVTGVGTVKLHEYGFDFINPIGQYLDDHPRRRRKRCR
jgi:ATP-dependent DNA helicase RecQ